MKNISKYSKFQKKIKMKVLMKIVRVMKVELNTQLIMKVKVKVKMNMSMKMINVGFVSYSDRDNPLICLCNCHNYIHYKCLKMYLISKIKIYENSKKTVTTYICEKFNCDICLKPYHLRFRIPEFDKTYDLIDLSSSENTDYIYLESLDYIKDNKNIKTLHIVNLEDPEITIGRNNYNDIIDNDTSISRGHAVLKYNKYKGNLFLEDKNSKYGTEVLVRRNIKLTKKRSFFLIWDTYISIKVLD